MTDKQQLRLNIDKIHTTKLGEIRIQKNLKLKEDAICYCKEIITNERTNIYKQGKNWYCELDNVRVTINAYSYTIITAHMMKYKD